MHMLVVQSELTTHVLPGAHAETKAAARAATAQAVLPVALLAVATLTLVAWPYLARIALPH